MQRYNKKCRAHLQEDQVSIGPQAGTQPIRPMDTFKPGFYYQKLTVLGKYMQEMLSVLLLLLLPCLYGRHDDMTAGTASNQSLFLVFIFMAVAGPAVLLFTQIVLSMDKCAKRVKYCLFAGSLELAKFIDGCYNCIKTTELACSEEDQNHTQIQKKMYIFEQQKQKKIGS